MRFLSVFGANSPEVGFRNLPEELLTNQAYIHQFEMIRPDVGIIFREEFDVAFRDSNPTTEDQHIEKVAIMCFVKQTRVADVLRT